MANVNRRDPNPNSYDISKVISYKADLSEKKQARKKTEAVNKRDIANKATRATRDRIAAILARHNTHEIEAY